MLGLDRLESLLYPHSFRPPKRSEANISSSLCSVNIYNALFQDSLYNAAKKTVP
jgi:hypothetical protein